MHRHPRRVIASSFGVLFLALASVAPALGVEPVNTGRFGSVAIR